MLFFLFFKDGPGRNRPVWATWATACNFDLVEMYECLSDRKGDDVAVLPWLRDTPAADSKRSGMEKDIAAKILLACSRRTEEPRSDDMGITLRKCRAEQIYGARFVYYAVEYMLGVRFRWKKIAATTKY